MADPFATGLHTLFRGPRSVAAVYQEDGGEPVPVSVIWSKPDETAMFGEGRIVDATNAFEIQRTDIDEPKRGALLSIDDAEFELVGTPKLDTQGLRWICGGEELV